MTCGIVCITLDLLIAKETQKRPIRDPGETQKRPKRDPNKRTWSKRRWEAESFSTSSSPNEQPNTPPMSTEDKSTTYTWMCVI
jgi:hypothetical protein